jgi:predicted ribosomally synthesized peptide with SipW-like signal peptide
MAASARTARRSRRTKIVTTVGALALVGAAGGYGTYAAFTDTTELTGSATAGAVRLNDTGADTRSITVAGLVPGDAPSACFVVAAPTAGNTQPLAVTLTAANTTPTTPAGPAATASAALAGSLTVETERVAATGEDFATTNGAAGSSRTLTRTSTCDTPSFASATARPAVAVAALGATPGGLTDTFTLAPGASAVYRVTLRLPDDAPQAAQGGTATFRLTWTGSAGTGV